MIFVIVIYWSNYILIHSVVIRYHRVKRKAEMRSATKMAEGEGPANNSETEMLEKADKLRAMVRNQINVCYVTFRC